LLLRFDIKNSLTRIALSLVLGIGTLTLLAVILGLVGALYAPVLWSIVGGLALFGLAELIRSYDRFRASGGKLLFHFDWRITTLGAITIVYAWLALLGALTPEVQFDGRLYHLADALRYAQHHRVYNLVAADRIFQNGLANYQETFNAFLIVMAGVGAAKAGAWCIGILAWYCLIAFVTDLSRSPVAGLLAGLLFVATPIVTWEMTTESTDLAEVPYALTALLCIHRWSSSTKNDGWLIIAGALSGLMFGIKATGGEFAAVALSSIAISAFRASRGSTPASVRWAIVRPVGVFIITAIPTAAIWLVLSFNYTGDPFFPAGLTIFHTPFSFPAVIDNILSEEKLHGGVSPWYAIPAVPFLMTYEVDKYRDFIGSIYVCGLPIVLLALFKSRLHDRAFMGALGAGALGFCLLYLTAVPEARYITWGLALAAGLIAVAVCDLAEWPDHRALGRTAPAVMLVAVLASNQFLLPLHRYGNYPGGQGIEFFDWSYLYEDAPEASVQLDYVPTIKYMNTHLPAESKVYDCANLVLFNSYSDVELFNGCGFGGPKEVGQWTLVDSDAYNELRSNSIGYIAITSSLKGALTKSALSSHLRLLDSEATPIFQETVMLYRVI